jgi:hypothetical protein
MYKHDELVEDHVIAGFSTGEMYDEAHLVAVAVPVIDFDTKLTTGEIGFIIDAEEAGEIRVSYIPTADQVADFPTAAEDRERFVRNRTVALGGV